MERPSRIAFGSCNNQDLVNGMWPIIESREPAAFVWGGDAIYADIPLPTDSISQHVCATPPRLKELYQRQLGDVSYRRLLDQNISIFGTFDDHDYGCNNADRTYEFKYESAVLYVKFLGKSASPAMVRRANAGHGVYGVKLFDFDRQGNPEVSEDEAAIDPDVIRPQLFQEPPQYSNRSVAVFVLDVRTHKTPWKGGMQAYELDYEGDFLGETQWQWFEEAIRRSRAAVNVVVNGLQVHANIYPNGNIAEGWDRYPRAQQRLFDALLQPGVEAPILISGDVHMTQFMRKDCVRHHKNAGVRRIHDRRSLVEMTTSGMTHSWGSLSSPPKIDPQRPPTWRERYQALTAGTFMHLLHTLCPWTSIMFPDENDIANGRLENGGGDNARRTLQYSLAKNFGELEFDWDERNILLRSFGDSPGAAPLLSAKLNMDQLSGRGLVPGGKLATEDFLSLEQRDHNLLLDKEWICVNYRGSENTSHMLGHITTSIIIVTLFPLPFLIPVLIVCWMVRRSSISAARKIS